MKKILVGIDFTDADEKVITWASNLAKAYGARLHLLHVYPPETAPAGYAPYAYPGVDDRSEELQEEKARLRSLVDGLKEEGLEANAIMKEGATAQAILEIAENYEGGILVVGTHSRNFIERALLGSTADHVIRRSKIPVLVVPNN